MKYNRETYNGALATSVIKSGGKYSVEASTNGYNLRVGGFVKTDGRDYLHAVAILTGIGILKGRDIQHGDRILIATGSPKIEAYLRDSTNKLYAPKRVKQELRRVMDTYRIDFAPTDVKLATNLSQWTFHVLQDWSGLWFPMSTASEIVNEPTKEGTQIENN
jgi:hypothetical protein